MGFMQKRKTEERDQIKQAGEPDGKRSSRFASRAVLHHTPDGNFHFHLSQEIEKNDDSYLDDLLKQVHARREARNEEATD